eukprot:TRINITY_DN9634_c0_g2_i3.p1 TRINITY_DN9634_c0_g2~~TRINITY_DN9634_c0_g2_i3.p1  ORF type:complete len:402 (-),score=75.91 TRINITY_DN9634_c0_g2_i3:457-1662(-)
MRHGRSVWLRRGVLCRTHGRNVACRYFVVSSPGGAGKRLVALTARVHAAETVGSFMMKGALEFLISNDPCANYLRENFIFLIVPMLNPDGVIMGHNRYDADGNDLNRKYSSPSKRQQPVIYYLKQLLYELSQENKLVFYCDMHAHSKSKSIFAYGYGEQGHSEQQQIFPFVLSQICPLFSFEKCQFNADKAKQHTARVVISEEFDICNVFTLEASFYGGSHPYRHYDAEDYESVGRKLCVAIAAYDKLGLFNAGNIEPPKEISESDVPEYSLKSIYENLKSSGLLKEVYGRRKFTNYPSSIRRIKTVYRKNLRKFTADFNVPNSSLHPKRRNHSIHAFNQNCTDQGSPFKQAPAKKKSNERANRLSPDVGEKGLFGRLLFCESGKPRRAAMKCVPIVVFAL